MPHQASRKMPVVATFREAMRCQVGCREEASRKAFQLAAALPGSLDRTIYNAPPCFPEDAPLLTKKMVCPSLPGHRC